MVNLPESRVRSRSGAGSMRPDREIGEKTKMDIVNIICDGRSWMEHLILKALHMRVYLDQVWAN